MLTTMMLARCFARPSAARIVLHQCLAHSAWQRTQFKLVIPAVTMASSAKTTTNQNKVSVNKSLTFVENQNKSEAAKVNRTLVLIFSWMLAKGKHLDKFVSIYANHGYDVLIVQTKPMQLVLPKYGSTQNAAQVLQFIDQKGVYSNLIVHGFSVGAYQFAEVLVKLSEDKALAKRIAPLFRALIFDSAANLAAIPNGFSRALTSNKVLQKITFFLLHLYLKLFYFIATKYYRAAENAFLEMNHFRVPSLLLVSERDPVGSVASNQVVADAWRKLGIPVTMKVWKDSKHVSHYYKHPEEYEEELAKILDKIK